MTWVTTVATLFLICVGGMVTSKGVGMAVPDWPNSFGYNMFLLPWNHWSEGGAFWEHSHRLKGSVVGLLTLVTVVWLWFSPASITVKRLGLVAFFGVVFQGILGGFRVVFNSEVVANTNFGVIFGVCHGAVAQLFFLSLGILLLLTSNLWRQVLAMEPLRNSEIAPFKRWVLLGTVAIFCQLLIGATMRHQHAGLAIPDFPLAYGKIIPDTSAAAIEGYNVHRSLTVTAPDITFFQIWLQMAHRIVAYGIMAWVVFCFVRARKLFPSGHVLRKLAGAWLSLIAVQVTLGALTIWTGKAADVATAHVAVGALSLMVGAVFSVVSFQLILSPESEKLRGSSAGIPSGAANA